MPLISQCSCRACTYRVQVCSRACCYKHARPSHHACDMTSWPANDHSSAPLVGCVSTAATEIGMGQQRLCTGYAGTCAVHRDKLQKYMRCGLGCHRHICNGFNRTTTIRVATTTLCCAVAALTYAQQRQVAAVELRFQGCIADRFARRPLLLVLALLLLLLLLEKQLLLLLLPLLSARALHPPSMLLQQLRRAFELLCVLIKAAKAQIPLGPAVFVHAAPWLCGARKARLVCLLLSSASAPAEYTGCVQNVNG